MKKRELQAMKSNLDREWEGKMFIICVKEGGWRAV